METITIKEIAKLCGVGVSTVSRAMNNHPDINEETKQKIMQVIKEYNYIPNNSARNLKRSASKTIGILIKGLTNPFFTKMMKVLEEEIDRNRYSFILQKVDEEEDEVEVALELIKEKRLKGIVFLGGYFIHSEEKLKQIPVPFVLSTITMQNTIDPAIYSSVSVDDVEESYKIVRYLCQSGYQKIAMLTAVPCDVSIGKLRIDGYKKALLEAEIPILEELIHYSHEEEKEIYSMKNGYQLAQELMKSGIEFDCVYAISDMIAIGACKALLEAGKRIPKDCAVAGFDGLDETFYYNPSITTIRQPSEKIARESIRILFELIYKKGENRHVMFPGELLIRESTKPSE